MAEQQATANGIAPATAVNGTTNGALPVAEPASSVPAEPAGPFDTLAAEDQAFLKLHRIGDMPTFVKHHRELTSLRGVPADQLQKWPGQDAKPEEFDPIHKRLGWPEKADDYKLDSIQVPEAEGGDPEFVNYMRPVAHQFRLSQSQIEGLGQALNAYNKQQIEAIDQALTQDRQADEAAVHREWGPAYEERMELVRQASRALGITADDIDGFYAAVGYKRAMDILSKVADFAGPAIREHAFVDGGRGPGTFGLTPQMAHEQLRAKMADREWTSKVLANPQGPEAQERDRLNRLAYEGTGYNPNSTGPR